MPRTQLLARLGADADERMAAAFARAGLVFAPPADRIPSTVLALCLVELARERGLHETLHRRLLDAYWAEGADIGDRAVLAALAAEAGIDDPETAWTQAGYRDTVLAATRQAHAIGVTGIPGFLLDRRLLVLGAQPEHVFEQAFAQLDETRNPTTDG